MCASPGGETTHIATLLRNTGTVIACDRTYRKSQAIVNLCKELHITNVVVVVADSRHIGLKDEQFRVCVGVKMLLLACHRFYIVHSMFAFTIFIHILM